MRVITSITLVIFIIFIHNTGIYAIENKNSKVTEHQIMNEIKGYEKFNRSVKHNTKSSKAEINDRRIIIKMKRGRELDIQRYNVNVVDKVNKGNILVVKVHDDTDYKQTLAKIEENNNVINAEPDYIKQLMVEPSDPNYVDQWHLPTTNLPKAWDITKGIPYTVIAVLDTGITYHTDIRDNIMQGKDFINGSTRPIDGNGHGTFVSTIIAAKHNGFETAGVAPNSTILPLKVAYDDGTISTYAEIEALRYAIDQNVDIINMSYGGYQPSSIISDLLWEANNAGVVLVAAAGNENTYDQVYPASHPGVISVSSSDKWGYASDFSNYGYSIDIAAPGTSIYSMNHKGLLFYGDGTSYSTPIISGVAALIKSKNDGWSPEEIEYVIEKSAMNNDGTRWNNYFGYGIVDAYGALTTQIPLRKNDVSEDFDGAKVVNHGELIQEELQLPLDMDTYKFVVKNKSETTIKISNVDDHIDVMGLLLKKNSDGTYNQVDTIDMGYRGQEESYDFTANPGTYYLVITEYDDQWSDQAYHLELTITPPASDRIYGFSRFDTAIEVSKQGWESSETVVLATSNNFPDALAGAPLAYQMDAPILLTNKDYLTNSTKKEIVRLGAEKVILLGGPIAISENIETELNSLSIQTQRVAGESRFDTAAEIATILKEQLPAQSINKAIIAYSHNFPDALTVASYAARNGYPILLSQTNKLPEATEQALQGINETIVVGGPLAIGDSVFNQLPNPTRIFGKSRFDTTVSIINELGLSKDKMFIATGYNFADALTGSVLAAKWNRPIVLVNKDYVPDPTQNLIDNNNMSDFIILGGPVAVAESTALDLLR